jgi:hypothetical protein
MGVPYNYLLLWNEYKALHDALIFEWEIIGMIADDTYFAYLAAERAFLEATGR